MMYRFTLLLLLPLLAAVQTPSPTQSRVDPDVWNVTDNRAMPIQYLQVRELKALLRQAAMKGNWSRERTEEETTKIPPGGFVLVSFARATPQLADPRKIRITVTDPKGQVLSDTKPASYYPGQAMVINQQLQHQHLFHIRLEKPLALNSRVTILEEPARNYQYLIKPL